jgi:hypothetical protein
VCTYISGCEVSQYVNALMVRWLDPRVNEKVDGLISLDC